MQRRKLVTQVIALIVLLVAVPALAWASTSFGDDHPRPGISRMDDMGQGQGQGPPSWAHGRHAKTDAKPDAKTDKDAAKAGREHNPAKEECDRPLPRGQAKRG